LFVSCLKFLIFGIKVFGSLDTKTFCFERVLRSIIISFFVFCLLTLDIKDILILSEILILINKPYRLKNLLIN
jgi:hypothetical protein